MNLPMLFVAVPSTRPACAVSEPNDRAKAFTLADNIEGISIGMGLDVAHQRLIADFEEYREIDRLYAEIWR